MQLTFKLLFCFYFFLRFSFVADPELEQNINFFNCKKNGNYLTNSDQKGTIQPTLLLSYSCFFFRLSFVALKGVNPETCHIHFYVSHFSKYLIFPREDLKWFYCVMHSNIEDIFFFFFFFSLTEVSASSLYINKPCNHAIAWQIQMNSRKKSVWSVNLDHWFSNGYTKIIYSKIIYAKISACLSNVLVMLHVCNSLTSYTTI